LGVAASTNIPGGRIGAVSWSDASGKLWLFGGNGYDSTGTLGNLNDLWKFDPNLGTYGEWTWMGGSNAVPCTGGGWCGQQGVYGTLGIAASANIPGGRFSAVSWNDASGNLWLFGGDGYDSTGTVGDLNLNDLWKFDPNLGTYGEWTWMGGSSTLPTGSLGVYATPGTGASLNPGSLYNAVSWSDASGNLWIFGGYGYYLAGTRIGIQNGMWEYQP